MIQSRSESQQCLLLYIRRTSELTHAAKGRVNGVRKPQTEPQGNVGSNELLAHKACITTLNECGLYRFPRNNATNRSCTLHFRSFGSSD